MNQHFKRFSAICSALVVSLGAMPLVSLSGTVTAADSYSVRDPFYNFSKGYNYYESEHFQFIWGNSGDSSKVTQAFLEGNAKNMEACWDVYMNELSMAPPSTSVNVSLRDGKEYKTNIYISGTGLEGMEDDWAYMAYDSGGFAYMFCCVDSMQYNPPSWVLPHEFGHVMTAHQLGWNSNKYSYAWWEAIGNWYREQYLYSDYSTDDTGHGTDFFETYMKNLCFTFPCGRDYYAAWPFLQYLTENPENLDGYGADFVKTMLSQGQVDEFPFDQVERLAAADFKDTLGYFAAHMAGLDFKHGDSYRARLNELLAQGDWNWQQIYTMLEPVAGREYTYKVPTERAPQFAGMNIVPINAERKFTVTLNAGTDVEGADWRACIVQQASDGSCTYSGLFKAGETIEVTPDTGSSIYLAVIATPDLDTVTKYGLPGIYDNNSEFSEGNVPFASKTRYTYSVTFGSENELDENVTMVQRKVSTESANWWEQATYTAHSNGGGLVASTAKVDDSVYVGQNAIVKGNATVTGNVRLEDYAVVEGNAKISGNAVISGYGLVAENAVISGNARVDDYGLVMGRAEISGNAKVIESACVYGNTKMTDNSVAKGVAFVMADAVISGQGVVDGDYYDDSGKTISKGTNYGWTSSQSYADSRPYTDKLLYAYDFDTNSSVSFEDRYNSTYGMNYGAEWESERTSAKGVLTFDGNDYIDLDRGVLYNDDYEIQLSVLSRNASDSYQELLYFGSQPAHFEVGLQNGCISIGFVNGTAYDKLVSEKAVNAGEWAKIRIISKDGTIWVIVNDETVLTGSLGIKMSDILSNISVHEHFSRLRLNADLNAAYRVGADVEGANGFTGSIDFVRIFSGETEAPSEVYTETEDISPDKKTVIIGDVNFDGVIDSFDVVRLRQTLILTGATASAPTFLALNVNGDDEINIADLVMLQNFVLGKIKSFPAGSTAEY